MLPTNFPQPTFWLSYGDLVGVVSFGVMCGVAAALVAWKTFRPVARLRWTPLLIVVTVVSLLIPNCVPATYEPYSDGYIWLVLALAATLGVCGFCINNESNGAATERLRLVLFVLTAFCVTMGRPPVTSMRSHGRTGQCKNNLKQIGLALMNYADLSPSHQLPGAFVGTPPVSWRVTVLPYIDQKELHDQYDSDADWNDERNLKIAQTLVQGLTCPSAYPDVDTQKRHFAGYALVTGRTTNFPDGRPVVTLEFGGRSQSAIAIEACGRQIVWTEPRDVDVSVQANSLNQPGLTPDESPSVGSSLHPRGVHVLLADGRVRLLSLNTDPKVLKALMTSDGTAK